MQTLDPLILRHPSLQALELRHRLALEGCVANAYFPAGRVVFREGGDADQFYLIRSGRVALEISGPGKGPLIVETIGEGEFLGWSWLFPPYRWTFDARAVEDTHAFALDGKCLRGKCEKDHDLGYELMKMFSRVMTDRLQATRLQLLDLYRKV